MRDVLELLCQPTSGGKAAGDDVESGTGIRTVIVHWMRASLPAADGSGSATARAVLSAIRPLPSGEPWSDVLSYEEVGLDHVRGHRQVTDAYLTG